MSTTNKKVIKSTRKNMVPKSALENKCFDFKTLPYVCQKRFAEILDPKTLKTFSNINKTTKNLSKRCHIVKHAEVKIEGELSEVKYTISCFCKENEFCHGVLGADLSSMKKKIDVHGFIQIANNWVNENPIIDARFLRSLPFNFNAAERLEFFVRSIKLDDFKMIIPPGLKRFGFYGSIESQGSLEEFMDFIKSLTHFEHFHFRLFRRSSSLSFNIDDLIPFGTILLTQKVITKFEVDRITTSFVKSHESL